MQLKPGKENELRQRRKEVLMAGDGENGLPEHQAHEATFHQETVEEILAHDGDHLAETNPELFDFDKYEQRELDAEAGMLDDEDLDELAWYEGDEVPQRHYLEKTPMNLVRRLVRNHGLRPVVDAVAAAALELHEAGETVKDEYGDPMADDDILTAAENLTNGDLY